MRRLRAIILDVGRGARRLDGDESVPRALETVEASTTTLHWLLNALPSERLSEAVYIGGYHLEKVVEQFPTLKVRYQGSADRLGELPALADLDWDEDSDHLVVRADTLMVAEAVERMATSDAPFAAGLQTAAATQATGFAGLLHVSAGGVETLRARLSESADADPGGDLERLLADLPGLAEVTLDGVASRTSDRAGVRSLVFRGKARTLEQLEGLVRSAVIAPQVRFTVKDWRTGRERVLAAVRERFGNSLLIARSSTAAEDGLTGSGAGEFHSELDIDGANAEAVAQGIQRVVASYSRDARSAQDLDEVLVQQQVTDLEVSGVALTRDPTTGAPYFVISHESGSGRSDVVTSGAAGTVQTSYLGWDAPEDRLGDSLAPVVRALREMVDLTHNDALDIEFGRERSGRVHVFQVRPMVSVGETSALLDADLDGIRRGVREFVATGREPHPTLPGKRTIFASMTDWNPVEMVGGVPGPLALSIYQQLIGNGAWATSRARIGYRDVGEEPLIVSLGGRPYVDVRKSLASLLPASLDAAVGARWVDHCIDRLVAAPELQDKVEFDVTVTCMDLAWNDKAARFRDAGLDAAATAAFRRGLTDLTNRFVTDHPTLIDAELASLRALDALRRDLTARPTVSAADAAHRVRHLVHRTRTLGAEPFSVLARFGFVALSLLRSLRDEGLVTSEDFDGFLRTTPTVAGELAHDVARFARGEVSLDHMVSTYGHLRPHSYDINAASYAMCPEMFTAAPAGGPDAGSTEADGPGGTLAHEALVAGLLDGSGSAAIEARLEALGLTFSAAQMLSFASAAIAARERAKFEYMKAVDTLLELVAAFGQHLELGREQAGWLTLDEVMRYATDSASGGTAGRLRRSIRYRRKRRVLSEALRLPEVVTCEDDVAGFTLAPGKPNFITRKRVSARVRVVENYEEGMNLNGDIVAIRAADPGFDWIFGHGIAGLVTEYGGAASHMAIRAAEFALPAAIGCGRLIFDSLADGAMVELDCANEKVTPL